MNSRQSKNQKRSYEKYDFEASPWTQNLTQRTLADLLKTTKDRLESLVHQKEKYIKKETRLIGKKTRELAYPIGKLRNVHEILKTHFNKIKLPDYVYSPRKRHSQRDNAELHAKSPHILTLDIKQFYPSTSSEHIFKWARYEAGLRDDVAGLLVRLIAIDNQMPIGSPVSPIFTTLIHRRMFDAIYYICNSSDLKMSLWVDDLTISGNCITGNILTKIREIIGKNGLKSHKIKFSTTRKPVVITGVPIHQQRVLAPNSLNLRIKSGYEELSSATTYVEKDTAITKLLSFLGSYRYHVGHSTDAGRKASHRMENLRQIRKKLTFEPHETFNANSKIILENNEALPWV